MDLAEIGRISSKHVKVSGALTVKAAAPRPPASTPPPSTATVTSTTAAVVTTMNNHFVNSVTKADSPPTPPKEKVEAMDVTEGRSIEEKTRLPPIIFWLVVSGEPEPDLFDWADAKSAVSPSANQSRQSIDKSISH